MLQSSILIYLFPDTCSLSVLPSCFTQDFVLNSAVGSNNLCNCIQQRDSSFMWTGCVLFTPPSAESPSANTEQSTSNATQVLENICTRRKLCAVSLFCLILIWDDGLWSEIRGKEGDKEGCLDQTHQWVSLFETELSNTRNNSTTLSRSVNIIPCRCVHVSLGLPRCHLHVHVLMLQTEGSQVFPDESVQTMWKTWWPWQLWNSKQQARTATPQTAAHTWIIGVRWHTHILPSC